MRIALALLLFLAARTTYAQLGGFDAEKQPSSPDFSQAQYWSALPFREDAADVILSTETWVSDSLKQVDVFFIYPTIYVAGSTWNADVNNQMLNKRIDNKPVRYQASVFNESCRVYAPRYRQAILKAFSDSANGEQALAFAYEDVKRAFEYYLKHYNQDRPFILASHSQGSHHARRLLKDYFDGTALSKQLVAAYVIGFGFNRELYTVLKPCNTATQSNCYITWASYKKGYEPDDRILAGNVCVNPLTWTNDTTIADVSQSKGAILLSFKKVYEQATATQVHDGYLWVHTQLPIVKGWKNMHIADYNLFWKDIRTNVKERISAFMAAKR